MNQARRGCAYLIGAGPGRADLITVRGLRLLQQADVVICDRLVARELLDEIRPNAELIFAGKAPGHHTLTQDAINRLLVQRVRSGFLVVRLKGGDPFVFGRGGEEALALRLARLDFEIVPGVSSALAAPAFAGVPVTQRGLTTSFAVVTGHEDPTKPETRTDWSALARMETLIVLMGIARSEEICRRLIAEGQDAETPALAVSRASTDAQQVVRSTLGALADAIRQSGLSSPAVIVIGEVAGLHDLLDWHLADGAAAGFVERESLALMPAPSATRISAETGA